MKRLIAVALAMTGMAFGQEKLTPIPAPTSDLYKTDFVPLATKVQTELAREREITKPAESAAGPQNAALDATIADLTKQETVLTKKYQSDLKALNDKMTLARNEKSTNLKAAYNQLKLSAEDEELAKTLSKEMQELWAKASVIRDAQHAMDVQAKSPNPFPSNAGYDMSLGPDKGWGIEAPK